MNLECYPPSSGPVPQITIYRPDKPHPGEFHGLDMAISFLAVRTLGFLGTRDGHCRAHAFGLDVFAPRSPAEMRSLDGVNVSTSAPRVYRGPLLASRGAVGGAAVASKSFAILLQDDRQLSDPDVIPSFWAANHPHQNHTC